ncbi:hypothetical protein [Pelagicoccus sp. SDUM812002]|uniref:hypothetical protein n=1 Tax=Pelagicoccus sp. SDUM812002 TaxID=3041266 RepID=UPI00280D455E|nr:hypothetical protein [Pelagicoccus sp. SDUM812002]MDQ8186660.1 hypothetical protein [Pelagicoccus sp. SDUM812002]
MRQIEIRLDPALVESLLKTIRPVLDALQDELATPAEFPDDDELLEDFWTSDLLNSQREELKIIENLFDDEFMLSGRALIAADEMDKVIRACSAIRLKLRERMLEPIGDSQLEEGNLEGVEWTDELQIGYAAYALFASLQELIISQLSEPVEDGSESEDDPDWSADDEDLEDER